MGEQHVAIITGGSQGIGAGLVAGYRKRGWAVVANSLAIKPSDDPLILAVPGDISQRETAQRIVGLAMERFARIDTLVNGEERHPPLGLLRCQCRRRSLDGLAAWQRSFHDSQWTSVTGS